MLETMHCYELQIISIYPKAPKMKLVNHISDVKRSFSKPQYSKNSVKAPSSLSFFHNYFHSFLFIVYSKALSGLVNKRPFLSNGQEEFLGTRQVLEHFVAESNLNFYLSNILQQRQDALARRIHSIHFITS